MANFNKGDVAYHKATNKRCVVSGFDDGRIVVTTEDDEMKFYEPEELTSEAEWKEKYKNSIAEAE